MNNFVKDGAVHLPPGFRFQPTEEEIVFQYLIRKTYSRPLPASVIPHFNNISTFDPWDLPGDEEQDRYFFSNNNGSEIKISTPSGYWKLSRGIDKNIAYSGKKQYPIIGVRKTLVFHRRRGRRCHTYEQTDWIMHEYRLVNSKNQTNSTQQIGNWVICHVFLEQRSVSENANITTFSCEEESHRVYDLNPRRQFHVFRDVPREYSSDLGPTSSSCSSSSHGYRAMPEVTSSHRCFVDDHEESSSRGL